MCEQLAQSRYMIAQLASYLINSSALPTNPRNMEFCFFCWSVWVRWFTSSDLSDSDNIVPSENTTSIKLINLLFVLLFSPYPLINQTGIFESRVGQVNCVESVQRKFTKRLPGFDSLDYKSRLMRLHADSLELRRLRYDLIYSTYKVNCLWSCKWRC